MAIIQGKILAGFNKDFQTMMFLRITDLIAARGWLRRLLPYVATTAKDEAFREGLSARATRVLNDPDSSEGAPSNWVFGGPGREADIVVIAASHDRADLDHEVARVENTIYDSLGTGASAVGPAWAKDGSFLVIRRLRQNVPLFRRFLASAAENANTSPELLGAKLVGRWARGAPVMRAPEQDNARLAFDDCANNHFEFQAGSQPIHAVSGVEACVTESPFCTDTAQPPSTGDRCPFAAHIRKTVSA
ncbi:MAG TPA: hypothetical protein VES20_07680 [Bryobacteraceae bacterium]|nr:hypothetical protein [Bryobacteraceae bacterium]